MAMYGADVAQLRQLSTQLSTKASDIEGIISQLTTAITSVEWMGPDANAFRSDWSSTHVAQLRQVVNALNLASQTAKRNADAQETTSAT